MVGREEGGAGGGEAVAGDLRPGDDAGTGETLGKGVAGEGLDVAEFEFDPTFFRDDVEALAHRGDHLAEGPLGIVHGRSIPARTISPPRVDPNLDNVFGSGTKPARTNEGIEMRPDDRRYAVSHEWARPEGEPAEVLAAAGPAAPDNTRLRLALVAVALTGFLLTWLALSGDFWSSRDEEPAPQVEQNPPGAPEVQPSAAQPAEALVVPAGSPVSSEKTGWSLGAPLPAARSTAVAEREVAEWRAANQQTQVPDQVPPTAAEATTGVPQASASSTGKPKPS